jgi:hypothetical protein
MWWPSSLSNTLRSSSSSIELTSVPAGKSLVTKRWFSLPTVVSSTRGEEASLRGVKVAYIFSTSGPTASYKLGKMILPARGRGLTPPSAVAPGGVADGRLLTAPP